MVIEWLRSPLVYAVDPGFRDDMLAFAGRFARRDAVARHYLHLGQRIEREFIAGRDEVKLKTLFYALRPAAALRWLCAHPGEAVAPMALPVLMAESDPPAEVADEVRALIAAKAVPREMGSAPAPPALTAFIRAEFEAAAGWEAADAPRATDEAKAAAAALYRATVERLDAG